MPENTVPQFANLDGDTINTTPGATVLLDVSSNAAPTVTVDATKVETDAVDSGPLVNPFGGLSFGDAEKDTLTVTISFDAAAGKLEVPPGLQAPVFEEKDGKKFYTFTGKPDAMAVIMDVLQFDAAERPLAEAGSKDVTTFTISVTDEQHTTPAETVVRVNTTIANRAPTDVTLDTNTAWEIVNGTVGTLSADDQPGAEFTYTLEDSAGGRFALATEVVDGKTVTKIVVANGLLLDYEQAKSHVIKVKVSDGKGGEFIKALTINIGDVAAEDIVGSAGADIFKGGADKDVIRGYAGNDKIYGGLGNDKLTGGAGKDIFVFDTKPSKSNKDQITDWSAKDDTIYLENAIFTKLTKTGTLAKASFVLGAKALEAKDFIGYDKTTGNVWYDSNGTGSGGQVIFANIGKNKAISNADFVII